MSKFRINYSISVKEIDKARLVAHSNGKTYLNMTMLVDSENEGTYGDHGFTTQQKGKDEPKELQLPILGNAKIVWREDQEQQAPQQRQQAPQQRQQAPQQAPPQQQQDKFDDDIPF